ncbi:MAG: hypothetical protein N3F63_05335 [Thermoplasmata archaeon]|nr:hypothetical protein [Thermoplasmata archaeon]
MKTDYLGILVGLYAVAAVLLYPVHVVFGAGNPVPAFGEHHAVYQSQNNDTEDGNPFGNFTPEQLFDPSSPLAILGYLSMFFCLSIPISLLIISIATIAIFVRMGKIRKELSQLNQTRQPPAPQHPQPQFMAAPQPPVQPQPPQASQQPPQGQQAQGQQGKQL